MARVFKKTITRYKDTDGRQVSKGTRGARKHREKSAKWYGRVPGNPRPVPLCANKGAAQLMLNELVKKAELAKAGVSDPFEGQRKRPLLEHLADFEADLKAAGDTGKHVQLTVNRTRWVLAACKFVFPDDPPASAVQAALARLRNAKGRSVQTSNHYLRAVKHFAHWMVKDRRMRDNPLAHLSGGNVKLDRRHNHRNMTPAELAAVLWAAQGNPRKFRGLSGADRFHLYMTAVRTGFRSSELASLTPESFELDATPPVAVLSTQAGKNKKALVRQPLPPDLVEALRGYLKGRPAKAPVWPGKWPEDSTEMLRIDLEAAGIPYEVEGPDGPRYNDFHGLRHAYFTSLEAAGVSVKTAQELARHSDIRLTLNRYTHKTLHDLGAAVGQLPPILPGERRERRHG
jgi:integrase